VDPDLWSLPQNLSASLSGSTLDRHAICQQLQLPSELAILLHSGVQPLDDAMDSAAVAAAVVPGDFRHPAAAVADLQPDGNAAVGLFGSQAVDSCVPTAS
jgi:hypothetical protein